jgi:hypothetical protein
LLLAEPGPKRGRPDDEVGGNIDLATTNIENEAVQSRSGFMNIRNRCIDPP